MFSILSSSIRSTCRAILTVFGCTLAALNCGCTSQQIQYQALAHNQGFSDSADKILLTNIIRASRIMPVDYTSITEYKAKEVASGSIVGKIPFGADALRAFNSDPTINVGPGIASLDIKDFAQQKESFARLYEDVEIQNFTNLRNAGWEQHLIATLLIQSIKIRGAFALALIERSDDICADYRSRYDYNVQCQMIEEAMSCGNVKDTYKQFRQLLHDNEDEGGWIVNSGDDRCEFLEFQSLLGRFRLVSIDFDDESTKKIVPNFRKEVKEYKKTIRKIYEETRDKLSGKSAAPFEITVRSTHLMVNFLGQLARAQLILEGNENWVPAIYIEDGQNKTPLFIVNKGRINQADAAISVDIDRNVYSIPEIHNNRHDKSLYLFRFTRTRLDQAYAQAKLPPSNTLILR